MVTFNNSPASPAPRYFPVNRNNRLEMVSYQQLFLVAHERWRKGRFAEAAQILERLCEATDRGPRAHILLALCRAMQSDFAGCSRVLHDALPTATYGTAAGDLHNAFVNWGCTLYLSVKEELEAVVDARDDLPTPCLLLADLLASSGSARKAREMFRQAIRRDRPDGAVALVARTVLAGRSPN